MSAEYLVEVFHADRDAWVGELAASIAAEVTALGVHHSVTVTVTTTPVASGPVVSVYFGSPASMTNSALAARLDSAVAGGRLVIPVVDSLANYSSLVPPVLARLNGWEWSGSSASTRLARRLLEELGIEDRRRRVFISHKRDDGLAAAEKLHDFLSHYGFEPFIDRFGVGFGRDVQNEIADALEDCAFLLLLETPLAHTSDWVFDEVAYAQTHQMGMHIVTWPGDITELPATNRWPRQVLESRDLRSDKGYDVFTDATLERILEEVEAIHAKALVSRRRYLLRSAEDAAHAARLKCTPLAGWRLLVEGPKGPSVVQVSARLPTVEDLHGLDTARSAAGGGATPGVLVHSARILRDSRREMLAWATGARDLTLLPENAVGGYWT
jgi:hypothetical protein